ncbi:group IID secretory phospholipase A2 isoform X1 [Dama dama]|uniref:group IID secretory phospholipase A2 isoform X1 n=2 Tax=Dama dama TaxID=30532 RepID=UPI002A365AE7|nr:group IID secretory phospholipase A2 isoform X1 [Dama dama]
MDLSLLCTLVVFAGVVPAEGDILDLNKMIKQVTGKTPVFFYMSYGCYCGFGGQGPPRDATDWCCHEHDCCYGDLTPHDCDIRYDHYDYTFFRGKVHCSTKGSWCEQQLCACDKTLAYCLQRNLNTYKNDLRYLSSCEGEIPECQTL